MRKLGIIIAAIMVAAVGFFAWRKQKDERAIDLELAKRSRGLDAPDMDETFAHEITPADPVQALRNGGAV